MFIKSLLKRQLEEKEGAREGLDDRVPVAIADAVAAAIGVRRGAGHVT